MRVLPLDEIGSKVLGRHVGPHTDSEVKMNRGSLCSFMFEHLVLQVVV
jgi:hypothetical protein